MKQSLQIVVSFYDEDPLIGYPLNISGYRQSYIDFFCLGIRRHPEISFFVARGSDYEGDGIFTKASRFDIQTKSFKSVNTPIKADIIYNKGKLLVSTQDTGNIINYPKFDRLCKDKMRTAHIFPEESPISVEVSSSEEVQQAVEHIPSEKVVLKPIGGQEGEDVEIHSKKKLQETPFSPKEPLILQEFLDTTEGIKGVTESIHDLRVLVMNGDIVQVYIRTPSEGKLISNVSQGGSLKEVDVDDLPKDILALVKKVDSKLRMYTPRIYSIDFGYTPDGPKIFELNSQPGLPYPEWTKYYDIWHEKLLETLLSSLNNQEAE